MVSVVSKHYVGTTQSGNYTKVKYPTKPGHHVRNEMDSHADTCCDGANWTVLKLTGEICEVTPCLDSYDPVNEIPITKCATVWTSTKTGVEYLLICDQMLWFSSQLPHSLMNPNQMQAFGIDVNGNLSTMTKFLACSLMRPFYLATQEEPSFTLNLECQQIGRSGTYL